MGREEEHNVTTVLFWKFWRAAPIFWDSVVGRGRDISGHEGGKEELTSMKPGWYSIDQ
jgi:hypothetical protein